MTDWRPHTELPDWTTDRSPSRDDYFLGWYIPSATEWEPRRPLIVRIYRTTREDRVNERGTLVTDKEQSIYRIRWWAPIEPPPAS